MRDEENEAPVPKVPVKESLRFAFSPQKTREIIRAYVGKEHGRYSDNVVVQPDGSSIVEYVSDS